MIWVFEMKNGGVFEAATRHDMIEKMVSHYVKNNLEAGQIKAVYRIRNNESVDELNADSICDIQETIDGLVKQGRKLLNEELEGQKQIESEVRGLIYG